MRAVSFTWGDQKQTLIHSVKSKALSLAQIETQLDDVAGFSIA